MFTIIPSRLMRCDDLKAVYSLIKININRKYIQQNNNNNNNNKNI